MAERCLASAPLRRSGTLGDREDVFTCLSSGPSLNPRSPTGSMLRERNASHSEGARHAAHASLLLLALVRWLPLARISNSPGVCSRPRTTNVGIAAVQTAFEGATSIRATSYPWTSALTTSGLPSAMRAGRRSVSILREKKLLHRWHTVVRCHRMPFTPFSRSFKAKVNVVLQRRNTDSLCGRQPCREPHR